MSDRAADPEPPSTGDRVPEDLVSALDVIESQPLTERPAGYAALHDELARRLDGSGAG